MTEFVLKRKRLRKGYRNYCWFLFFVIVVLMAGSVAQEVVEFFSSKQSFLSTLRSSWFPALMLIITVIAYRLFSQATREDTYAVLNNNSLSFPSIPKTLMYDGLPGFREWPISEIKSAKTKFVDDPQLRDQYGLRAGPALQIEGAYWSISMPAIKLDGVAKFVGSLNKELKERGAKAAPSEKSSQPDEDVSAINKVSDHVKDRECYLLAIYALLTFLCFGLAIFVDALVAKIPGIIFGLYCSLGVFQRLLTLISSLGSTVSLNNNTLKFTTGEHWWLQRGYAEAFDFPKGDIDLSKVNFIRYSHFPPSKLVFPIVMKSFIVENITLVCGDVEYRFYNVFENSDELLNQIYRIVAQNQLSRVR